MEYITFGDTYILASLKSVPIEQIDAASVDGANKFQTAIMSLFPYDSFYNYYDINVYFFGHLTILFLFG